jgi:predicted methyltransferase
MNRHRTPNARLGLVLGALSFSLGCASSGGGSGATPPAAVPTTATAAEAGTTVDTKLKASIAGPQRTEKERARDVYRHPRETLEFFGLKDTDTVLELSPGEGWYTAVLAPVLHDRGKLIVAGGDPKGDPNREGTKNALALQERFQKAPQAFDRVQSVVLSYDASSPWGAPESADMVLTFRNLHNWIEDGKADAVLAQAFKVLKHGGVLGLTDHRANPSASTDPKAIGETGYVPEAYVEKIVEAAGFKLAAKSDINANPKDTKDYPKGVWTLPPVYAAGDADHAKYEAIGESDRMTLKFVKP